jgi:murein endopeptidase
MRLFALVAVLVVVAATPSADARGRSQPGASKRDAADQHSASRKKLAARENKGGPQSFGAPWAGRLANPTRLTVGERAVIRRPYRAYGTRTTVDFTKRAIQETLELHPKAHVLAVGDISAEHGGPISDHQSHQSGRDIDLGLFYKKKPANYPTIFIDGTEDNLDCAATWTLVSKLAATADKDGGVWAIFLDHEVQGILYRWAKNHGVSEKRLQRVFQYPHGRGANAGIVRHYRNHAHHIHVRFKCTKSESDCRY